MLILANCKQWVHTACRLRLHTVTKFLTYLMCHLCEFAVIFTLYFGHWNCSKPPWKYFDKNNMSTLCHILCIQDCILCTLYCILCALYCILAMLYCMDHTEFCSYHTVFCVYYSNSVFFGIYSNPIWLTTQVSVHGRKCVTAYGKRVSTVQHRTRATARVFDYFNRGMHSTFSVNPPTQRYSQGW